MHKTTSQLDTKLRKKYQKQISKIFAISNTSKKMDKAWYIARKISAMLKEKYSAKKVVVFGSLATKSFNNYSDIDIGVLGIGPGNFYKAIVEARALSYEFDIDILDIKDCNNSFKEKILNEGINV